MAISGIEVHESVFPFSDKIKGGKIGCFFMEIRPEEGSNTPWVFPIEDEECILPSKATLEDLKTLLAEKFAKKSLYGVFDFNARHDGRIIQKAFFLYWSPDGASLSEKVTYGTTKEGIAGAFPFCSNLGQITDLSEINENKFRAKINLPPVEEEGGEGSS